MRPPGCTIAGYRSVAIAWAAGCTARNLHGVNASIDLPGLRALARRETVVVLVARGKAPQHWTKGWTSVPGLPPGSPRALRSPAG